MNVHDEDQYRLRVYDNDTCIDDRGLTDPFAHTTIVFHLSRWDAFKAIFKPLQRQFRVHVTGSEAAYRVVFNGDYTPPPPVEVSEAVGFYNEAAS